MQALAQSLYALGDYAGAEQVLREANKGRKKALAR
jgi:hypothetical protein